MPADDQSNNKLWFGVAMVLIGVVVGYSVAKSTGTPLTADVAAPPSVPTVDDPTIPEEPEVTNIQAVDTAKEHIRGNKNATVSVIEYSDYECPFCARVHPTMKQIVETYGDKVNIVFRHFPLSFHPNAQKAAEATECATELGGNDAFWKLSDIIYERGADNTKLTDYAKEIGLNETAFKTCLDSGKYVQKITDMMQTGTDAGVRGTPGNIVYNNETKVAKMVSGAQPFENFKAAIDELLGS